MKQITLIIIVSICWCLTVAAQTPRPDPSQVLKQLLELPAPVPRSTTPETELVRLHPDGFYDQNNPPPDDASIEDLIDYWTRFSSQQRLPSDVVRQRLLEGCLSEPVVLSQLINLMPETDVAVRKIKEVYDKTDKDDKSNYYLIVRIKDWLLYNSRFFLDELIGLARKFKENEKDGSLDKTEALAALAKVSWEDAEPMLRSLATSGRPRSEAFAHSLFYEHAMDENDAAAEGRYRNTLKAIASNRTQPAYARDCAIQALSTSEWSGRDEWYLRLFEDETLLKLSDPNDSFLPLTTLSASDPDRWIPIMARLTESKDLTVRSAAVQSLISLPKARRDALLPLLEWLSNPAWVTDAANDRLKLIQSMDSVDIPESVPGLIAVIESAGDSQSNDERSYAAESLAKYKDARAIPSLKRALTKEKDEHHRNQIIRTLIACQGLSDAEQLQALEAYAAKLMTPEGRAEVEYYRSPRDTPLSATLAIGKYLSNPSLTNSAPASDSLVHAVLARAESLKSENLPLANALIEITHRWQGRQVDLDMIRRIADGTADVKTISEALKRRVNLRETLLSELQGLASVSGTGQGIGAVLLEDQSLVHGVLDLQDQSAQIALLACSRLALMSLPVELVGPFLSSKNSLLALSAERYLLIEDSKEAQQLLLQHNPNKAYVTGWGENGEYTYGTYGEVAKTEAKLRAELLKENGPIEIIALLVGESHNRVVRVFPDKIVYTYYEDAARYREREVSPTELSSLKEFLASKNLPDLGPQFGYCHHDCRFDVFLTVTQQKGRRVYSLQGYGAWTDVREHFDALGEGAKLHYNLETQIKGLEVLYADKSLVVKDVWQQGAEIRILVERGPSDEEDTEEEETEEDDDSEAAMLDRWRKEVAREKARSSWHVFANNKAGAATSPPEIYSTIDISKFPPDEEDDSVLEVDDQVQKLNADSIIIARNQQGLWKQLAGTKAVRVSNGESAYSTPVVTADGKWVVVAKMDVDWSNPKYIVRFNSRTGREFRVNLEPADSFLPIAFVGAQGRVLLCRSKNEYYGTRKPVGPDRPEYYLLDPNTGETRPVTGEFTPLRQRGRRSLQPSDQPNEVWAAIPDAEKNQTQVGRYNLKDFTFKSVLTLPHINFDSMAMWVDAKQKKIYVVYNDQLLRLPLPN